MSTENYSVLTNGVFTIAPCHGKNWTEEEIMEMFTTAWHGSVALTSFWGLQILIYVLGVCMYMYQEMSDLNT